MWNCCTNFRVGEKNCVVRGQHLFLEGEQEVVSGFMGLQSSSWKPKESSAKKGSRESSSESRWVTAEVLGFGFLLDFLKDTKH
jgi:hypothetical protein